MKVYYGLIKISTLRNPNPIQKYMSHTDIISEGFVYTFKSIRIHGVRKPIVVFEIDGVRTVMLGGARVRALLLLKASKIPAIIFTKDDIKGLRLIKSYDELLNISKLQKIVVTKDGNITSC